MGICVSCRRRDRKAPEKRWVPATGGPAKGAAAELLPRRWPLTAMANSISNIKMTNPIKGMVSKRRIRYMKDGFNLDLAYITERLIAMGFPGDKFEGVYRNHIDDVYKFLEQMHKGHYKIYNLCAERTYDHHKFHDRVKRYELVDHAPPGITQIQEFCEDVHLWLNEDPRNVAVVHCKAGKGRTGTMVCCYLLYCGQKETADMALQFYGHKRTHDKKGVTIPSQRRYVDYYAAMVRGGLSYRATRVHVRELLMSPPPALTSSQCTLEVTVTQPKPNQPFKASLGSHELRREGGAGAASARVCAAVCTPLAGDVRVDVYCKPKMMRKERLFHFWFNTFFVTACVGAEPVPAPDDSPNLETFKLTLDKWQLDDAHKDKQHKLYSPDFKVELIIQKQPESSTFSGHSARASSSLSSCASSGSEPDTEPDATWDSGERLYRCPYYHTDYEYPDSYSKPDDYAPPEYTPIDDDKLYMNVNDNPNANQYEDNGISKQHISPRFANYHTNVGKLFTHISEYPVTTKRLDGLENRTRRCGDDLDTKDNFNNELNKSDDSNDGESVRRNIKASHVKKSKSDDVFCRNNVDTDGESKAKSSVDDDDDELTRNASFSSESCTCKLVSLVRNTSFGKSFASHLGKDDKNLYTDQFELPLNSNSYTDKPEQDYALNIKSFENPLYNFENENKIAQPVNTDWCDDLSKNPVGNMQTDNFENVDTELYSNTQFNNMHINTVDNINMDCANEPKYSISKELSDLQDKPLNYFAKNLTVDKDNEYLNGKNNCSATPQYAAGAENPPEYPTNTEKPPEYSIDSKKDFKCEEFSKKDKKCKYVSKPRLSLGDMRASWREFSGKFGENRKKKHKEDRQ